MDNVKDNVSYGKSFKYKTKITRETESIPAQCGNDGDADRPPRDPATTLNVEVTVLLKYFSTFWRSLDLD